MGTRMLIPLTVWAQQRYCSTLHCCRRNRPFLVWSVWVQIFSAVQALCCPSTVVGTCAALHNAAEVDAVTFSAAVRTDTVG